MIDVYDIYKEVLGQVNKEENGYLPADLFNGYARSANRDVFNDYLARLQNPQTAAVEKLKLEDRLAPFEIASWQPAIGGIFVIPTTYAYFRSAKIKGDGGQTVPLFFALQAELCEADNDPTINVAAIQAQLAAMGNSSGLVAVTLMDHDQVSKRLNSYVPGKAPSFSKPIMERITTTTGDPGFQVHPAGDYSVLINYYQRPAITKLVMKLDPAGTFELVYDLAASTGFQWGEEAMSDIVSRIVTSFATYIREGGLFQMNNSIPKM
jgi:hypothetical protein